jgi:hypothetical protein
MTSRPAPLPAPRQKVLPRWPVLRTVLLGVIAVAGLVAARPLVDAVFSGTGWRAAPDRYTFASVPPDGVLPSGEECTRLVRRSTWEPRPENSTANHRMPSAVSLPDWDGFDRRANTTLRPRIDGRFTGTTDEILQWGSCKWGIDTDLVRAMAVQETNWVQDSKGDYTRDQRRCLSGEVAPCPVSFGLLQIKYYNHPGTYPSSLHSTAFNVDYALGVWRACYEGWIPYLGGDHGQGDLWGCVGHHFSGSWRDPGANAYANEVRGISLARPWQTWRG